MGFTRLLGVLLLLSVLADCAAPASGTGNSTYAPYLYDWRRYNLRDH